MAQLHASYMVVIWLNPYFIGDLSQLQYVLEPFSYMLVTW